MWCHDVRTGGGCGGGCLGFEQRSKKKKKLIDLIGNLPRKYDKNEKKK